MKKEEVTVSDSKAKEGTKKLESNSVSSPTIKRNGTAEAKAPIKPKTKMKPKTKRKATVTKFDRFSVKKN